MGKLDWGMLGSINHIKVTLIGEIEHQLAQNLPN